MGHITTALSARCVLHHGSFQFAVNVEAFLDIDLSSDPSKEFKQSSARRKIQTEGRISAKLIMSSLREAPLGQVRRVQTDLVNLTSLS